MLRRMTPGVRAAAAALIAALLVSGVATSGCALVQMGRLTGVIEPTIKPSPGVQGSQKIAREWEFEDGRARISVPIDRAVYAGSKTAEKSAIFVRGTHASDWVPDYYRAFISERHQNAFFSAMLEALHALRTRDGLDDARYVELVTTMAQGFEYRVDPGELAPKFPIETFGDGFGDCDDKALLAAALLSRDGYDVAILVFDPEKHVAMGIRAAGLDYKGTGYAYVELTGSSLVGVVPDEFDGGIQLTSQPEVIKIGQGQRAYTAGDQIEYIQRRLAELRAEGQRAQAEIRSDKAKLDADNSSLQAERQSLDGISDPAQLAAAVEAYNAHVRAANGFAAQANQRISRYNAMVAAEAYAVDHAADRPGVYRRMKAVRL